MSWSRSFYIGRCCCENLFDGVRLNYMLSGDEDVPCDEGDVYLFPEWEELERLDEDEGNDGY